MNEEAHAAETALADGYVAAENEPARKAPSRGLAALLSLLGPGLGHVYAGRIRRGVAWALAALLVRVPLPWLTMRLAPGAFVVIFGLSIAGLWLGAAGDAARTATHGARSAWGRVIVAALVLWGVGRLSGIATRSFVVETFNNRSASMVPTLLVGDRFFVDKTREGNLPARGEIVVLRYPEHRDETFVERVVALPGDTLEVRHSRIWLNDAPVPRCRVGLARWDDEAEGSVPATTLEGELYVEFLDTHPHLAFYAATRLANGNPNPIYAPEDAGPWTAGPDEVLVLGDNRNSSNDSRWWFDGKGGGVPVHDVLGRVFSVWPSTSGDGGTRTELLGHPPAAAPTLPASMRALQPALDRCLAPNPPMEAVR